MLDKNAIEIEKQLDLDRPRVESPERFVDFDITTSFAHCTPNLTCDEVFGYALMQRLSERFEGRMNALFGDYDGTRPEKEDPNSFSLENTLTDLEGTYGGIQHRPVWIPTCFESGVPTQLQNFRKDEMLRRIRLYNWQRVIKNSNFAKTDKPVVLERFLEVADCFQNAVGNSDSTLEFLTSLRKGFLELAGISCHGNPSSSYFSLYKQKLEEDLQAGFPFWRMDLPEEFSKKHKSNDRTYLFWGVSSSKNLTQVKFFENPDRFVFRNSGNEIEIPAEETPQAMLDGKLIPTASLLNYIVLSPARKKPTTERRKRAHIAGRYMAGAKGYANQLIPYFNKVPGFDEVSLICTNYPGGLHVKDSQRTYRGFASVYPQFGREGISEYLRTGEPTILRKGKVITKKSGEVTESIK